MSKANTVMEATMEKVVYEDDKVVLTVNEFGVYIEHIKRTLGDIVMGDYDECSEEALDVLEQRGLARKEV